MGINKVFRRFRRKDEYVAKRAKRREREERVARRLGTTRPMSSAKARSVA